MTEPKVTSDSEVPATDEREWLIGRSKTGGDVPHVLEGQYPVPAESLIVVPKSRAESAERERDHHREQETILAERCETNADEVERLQEVLRMADAALNDMKRDPAARAHEARACIHNRFSEAELSDNPTDLARAALTTSDKGATMADPMSAPDEGGRH